MIGSVNQNPNQRLMLCLTLLVACGGTSDPSRDDTGAPSVDAPRDTAPTDAVSMDVADGQTDAPRPRDTSCSLAMPEPADCTPTLDDEGRFAIAPLWDVSEQQELLLQIDVDGCVYNRRVPSMNGWFRFSDGGIWSLDREATSGARGLHVSGAVHEQRIAHGGVMDISSRWSQSDVPRSEETVSSAFVQAYAAARGDDGNLMEVGVDCAGACVLAETPDGADTCTDCVTPSPDSCAEGVQDHALLRQGTRLARASIVDRDGALSLQVDTYEAPFELSSPLTSEVQALPFLEGHDVRGFAMTISGRTDPPGRVWPNAQSQANSDAWISENHDEIVRMRPRVLVINFANGVGRGGLDEFADDRRPTDEELRAKAESFLSDLRIATTPPGGAALVEPEIAAVLNLTDASPHVNSRLFPRGQRIPSNGYQTVGYSHLFDEEFAASAGLAEALGTEGMTLGDVVASGLVHDIIMIANQVDGRAPNPPDEVTSNILEVAFLSQAYADDGSKLDGHYIKNGQPFDRQRSEDWSEHDHNSMPWSAVQRSLRIYFLNYSRGTGCLMHSLGHDLEFRYNESQVYAPGEPVHRASPFPFLQPHFRRFADFELDERIGAPFDSLYSGGDDYTYEDCSTGVCQRLRHPRGAMEWTQGCGNVHYPPGAENGYQYSPTSRVNSYCESFGSPDEVATPLGSDAWRDLERVVDNDCGGPFIAWWMSRMPGVATPSQRGPAPMRAWGPYMYY